VSSSADIEQLEAEARYRRERLSLLRARMYRGGAAPEGRLREYERALEGAEQRLEHARRREARAPEAG
jgi:hypothetical protein